MQRIEFDGSDWGDKTSFAIAWFSGRNKGIALGCECGHDISWHGRITGKCYGFRFNDGQQANKSEPPLCPNKCWKFIEDVFMNDIREIREKERQGVK